MEQRVWVYKANNDSFWIAREPVFDPTIVPAPRPILEIGLALIEPYELADKTHQQLAYAGVAKLTALDSDVVILHMDPTDLRMPTPGLGRHASR